MAIAPNIEQALIHFVSQQSAITAVISNRFYPLRLPPTPTVPASVFLFLPGGSLVRGHNERATLERPVVQLEFWGKEQKDAANLERLFFDALDGQRGLWGTGDYQVKVSSCLAVATPFDLPDSTTKLYRRIRDYRIMWSEKET